MTQYRIPKKLELNLKNTICANMAADVTLSAITDLVVKSIGGDKQQIFTKLALINAKAVEDRYGSEISKSLHKAGRYKETDFPEIQVSAFLITYLEIMDCYLDTDGLKNPGLNLLEELEKINRSLVRQKKSYNHPEFMYFKNFLYYYYEDEDDFDY